MDTKNFNVGRRDRSQRPKYGAEVDEYGFELEPELPAELQDEPEERDVSLREQEYEAERIGDEPDDYDEPKKPGFFARLFGKREQPEYDDEYDDEYDEMMEEEAEELEPPLPEARPKREKRGRDRKVIEELRAELPQEPPHPVLTFIVPREQLPDLSLLTPLGAPARRKPAPAPIEQIEPEVAAEPEFVPTIVPVVEPAPTPALIYDAEPEEDPEPIYEAEPEQEQYVEPVKPRLSRREQRRRKRAHRFKLMVDFAVIRGADTLTPYGRPISQKNRIKRAAIPAMAAAPVEQDYRDYEPETPEYDELVREHFPQREVEEEPAIDDEDDGLSLPINEGFGFAPVEVIPPAEPVRVKKKRLHYALGDRRISPQLARRLKPYTLPPVESAPPKRERASVRERASHRRPQRGGRNNY